MRNLLSVLFVSLVVCSACGKGSPTSPSVIEVPPSPPVVEVPPYESLPARHSLGDASEKLWAELVSVTPLRGSLVVLGPFTSPPDCSRGACFSAVINLGFDEGFANPNVKAHFDGYFVGESGQQQRIFGLGAIQGVHTWTNGGSHMIFLGFAPKKLLLEGSYPGSCWPPPSGPSNCSYASSPPGEGATTYLLDYRNN